MSVTVTFTPEQRVEYKKFLDEQRVWVRDATAAARPNPMGNNGAYGSTRYPFPPLRRSSGVELDPRADEAIDKLLGPFDQSAFQEQERFAFSEIDRMAAERQNLLARDAARRGMFSSGQLTAQQRDVYQRAETQKAGISAQFGVAASQMQNQNLQAAAQMLMSKYGIDKNAATQLAMANAQGSGALVGLIIGLGLMLIPGMQTPGAVVAGTSAASLLTQPSEINYGRDPSSS